jgi:hypothetical protein
MIFESDIFLIDYFMVPGMTPSEGPLWKYSQWNPDRPHLKINHCYKIKPDWTCVEQIKVLLVNPCFIFACFMIPTLILAK